jgi:hypothetical protein
MAALSGRVLPLCQMEPRAALALFRVHRSRAAGSQIVDLECDDI